MSKNIGYAVIVVIRAGGVLEAWYATLKCKMANDNNRWGGHYDYHRLIKPMGDRYVL